MKSMITTTAPPKRRPTSFPGVGRGNVDSPSSREFGLGTYYSKVVADTALHGARPAKTSGSKNRTSEGDRYITRNSLENIVSDYWMEPLGEIHCFSTD
jgi:hypothetical protein